MSFKFFIIFWCLICRSFCGNILAILAVPFYSHHIIHHQILQELASRGHNLTIFTPYIMNYGHNSNVTQHYLDGLVDTFKKYTNILDYKLKKLSTNEIYGFWEMRSTYKILGKLFQNQKFRELFENREGSHYDLIMTECLLCSPIVLAELYDCSIVSLNAGESHVHQHQMLGNFAHSSIHPDIYVQPVLHAELTFVNRIKSFIIYKFLVGTWKLLTNILSDYLLYSNFPHLSYTNQEEVVQKRLKLFLSFTSSMTASIRPTVPLYHQVGFNHVKEPKEIKDKTLVDFLDKSENGVVILSFGSVVGDLNDDLLMRFYEVFKELPYKIIWKTNVSRFEDLMKTKKFLVESNENSLNAKASKMFSTKCQISNILNCRSTSSMTNSMCLNVQKITSLDSCCPCDSFEYLEQIFSNKKCLESVKSDLNSSICCKESAKHAIYSKNLVSSHKEAELPKNQKDFQKTFKINNILASNWLPLADILAHPNVKLLISHSGLRTIEESIDREVPMILIPLSYDQPFNAIIHSQHKVALHVDINNFTKESLINDILEMTKPEYKRNIKTLKTFVYDTMKTGMQDAMESIEELLENSDSYDYIKYDAANSSEFSKSFYDVYLTLFIISYLSSKIIKKLSAVLKLTYLRYN